MKEDKFWMAVLVPATVGLIACYASIFFFNDYGLVLFVCLPFLLGFAPATIYGRSGGKGFGKSFGAGFLSMLTVGFGLILFAIEGIMCLIMALPLATLMVLIGTTFGYFFIKYVEPPTVQKIVPLLLIALLPFLFSFESSTKSEPAIHKVASTVEINAPIEKVWQNVVAFPQIEKPPEGVLKLGFAYPINAKIEGEGVGAIRYCNFNTGAFVEPITTWQAPNLLAFDVKKQPAPMIETSIYKDLHAPHLDYIKSQRGQFRLYEKDGKTIVEGTTFYTHEIAPDFYWKLFSDEIIHQIHLRVLNHIKEVSEKN